MFVLCLRAFHSLPRVSFRTPRRDVDGGHAAANYDHPASDRQRGLVRRLAQSGDVVDCVRDTFDLLAIQPQVIDARETEAEEYRVEFLAQLGKRYILAQADAIAHFDAADAKDVFDLARGEIIHRLVRRDAVFIEPAQLFLRLEY